MTDADGKTYLDFLAGWCVGNVGWEHHSVIQAIKRQAEHAFFVPPWLQYEGWEKFASRLVSIMPDKRLQHVFRATSGSEAVEFAIKCARAVTGKKTIVSLERVYHGHTYGAASVGNALNDAIGPGVPSMIKLPMPDEYHGIDTANVVSRFEHLIRANRDIAAFISEPVWSNAGVIIPPRDFYATISQLCRQHGIMLIMDEVATGFGRCGSLFASSLWDLKPDMICLGKGMTGGYGALAATVVTDDVYKGSQDVPLHATFAWNPQDLAAAEAVVDVILRDRLWENAHDVGSHLVSILRGLENRPYVGQVRSAGLLLGIEIVKTKNEKEPDERRAEEFVNKLAEAGLLVDWVKSTLFISPPLTLSRAEAEEGAAIIDKVLD